MTPADRELRQRARHVLTHHRAVSPSAVLAEMAQSPYVQLEPDDYGDGGAIAVIE